MSKYEVRYHQKRQPLDSMPPVVQSFPIFAKDDADARRKADGFKQNMNDLIAIEIVGLREVTYRDVPL